MHSPLDVLWGIEAFGNVPRGAYEFDHLGGREGKSSAVDTDGDDESMVEVVGQVAIQNTPGLGRVSVRPADIASAPDVREAILGADQVVLGPGSLFTSVLAAAVVPDVAAALAATTAQRVFVANLRPQVPETEGFLVLYTPDRTYRLDPIPGAFHEVRSLDGAWLEHTLGEVPVTYQHGLAETLAAVDEGRAACAVLIRPVSVAEIERTAREGLLMPPKSTFFTPKLRTGLVVRPLDLSPRRPAEGPWAALRAAY